MDKGVMLTETALCEVARSIELFYDNAPNKDWLVSTCKNAAEQFESMRAELQRLRAEDNKPLTLDELRQMGGEPIWIKEFPPYAFAGYKVLSLRVVDVYGDIVCEDGDIYDYERYGKTWLAYRSKPKEEQPCD